jgi:hypothetical protein
VGQFRDFLIQKFLVRMPFEQLKSYLNLPFQEATQQPVYWYALILLLFLFLVLWSIRKLRNDLVPVFHDDEGGVQITTQALQELVKKSCQGIEGIDAPTTKIKMKRGAIRLYVRLSVNPQGDIKEIRSLLRNNIEKIMVENLNFANFGGVDIVIKGFQES